MYPNFPLPEFPSTPTRDSITLKNLQLPHGIIAPDVWGQPKDQPALITLSLHLHGSGFSSASSRDELDNSTIHYGHLAKKIRAACREGQDAGELAQSVEGIIWEMGMKVDGDGDGGDGDGKKSFIVARSTVEVNLPKASMFGEGVTLINATNYDAEGKVVNAARIFSLKDIKIMTLVGVNSYERTMKQPLVVSILLHWRPDAQTMDLNSTVTLFKLEQTLVEIVDKTAFETLETLADFTVAQLRKKVLDSVLPGTRVQLRIEKPRAIAFADAPVVEIMRDVPDSKRSTQVVSTATAICRESNHLSSAGPQDPQASTMVASSRPPTAQAEVDPNSSEVSSRASAVNRLSVIKPYDR